MKLDLNRAAVLVRDFKLAELFNEAGWDHPAGRVITLTAGGEDYTLAPVAEKHGVQIFECTAVGAGMPLYAVRQALEREVRKIAHEHLIIFTDSLKTQQLWQWVSRSPGGPVSYRKHVYHAGQNPLATLQKLDSITFTLADEGDITLLDVTQVLGSAFDKETVTKRFYDRYKTEHTAFVEQIEGIVGHDTANEDREWYASLMLNRLMFIYFIQKKWFLNSDSDYLRSGYERTKASASPGSPGFYRGFLLPLFREGLGADGHSAALKLLLGKVPYLNGGLFELHILEERYTELEINDEAFDRLFAFFDAYQWGLDDRPLAQGNEINPDVLGYIFEKYVNQKQMGAYYTKEDITEYMTRNTIVPWLLETMARECAVAFGEGAYSWQLLQHDPERYVLGLIAVATTGAVLPGETEREAERRAANTQEKLSLLSSGQVRSVSQLVDLNLDVRQYLQDVIEQSEGPEVVRAAYTALGEISVLDPTCGSGAFLFAALGVLEPIYEACLERMKAFVDESDDPDKFTDFRRVLGELAFHPSRKYYVMKRIIMDNLFGVDVMAEAVEICKLRLFLRLVSQVEDAKDLEPLPDIDFNIQHGNTLVGYATVEEIESVFAKRLDFNDDLQRIKSAAASVASDYAIFREANEGAESGSAGVKIAKATLRAGLDKLRAELDGYLAEEQGIKDFDKWHESHVPFHWLIEFHSILARGGFDVVIGNPPYVAMNKVRAEYVVQGYKTDSCPDIYAPCMERSVQLLSEAGRFAMIVPISFQFSEDFRVARNVFRQRFGVVHVSTFSRNPAALFSAGLGVRSSVVLAAGSPTEGTLSKVHTTKLLRWVEECRPHLFELIEYAAVPESLLAFGWPRTGDRCVADLLASLVENGGSLAERSHPRGAARMGYKTTALYYVSAFAKNPPAYSMDGRPEEHTMIASLSYLEEAERDLAVAVALSRVALLWWACTGDDFHVTAGGLLSTPVAPWRMSQETVDRLLVLSERIQAEMTNNVIFTKYAGKMMGNYDIKCVRHLTDEVDARVLKELGLEQHGVTLDLFYDAFVKQTGERPGTVRELPASFFAQGNSM